MIITAKVKTGSSQEKIVELHDHDADILIYVREKPHDNLANQKIIQLLSKYYNTPKTQIGIIRGQKSKIKTFSIAE